jgi:hypothetical protein
VAKPWAKLEIDFIDHPKFRALNSNAICLWLEAKNYCDKHATDGLLPTHAVKGFRFAGKKSIQMLLTSIGQKDDSGAMYQPLWVTHPVGYKMVGYLDHNDCREAVLARMDDADQVKELRKLKNKERQAAFRRKRQQELDDLERRLQNNGPPNGVTERRVTLDVTSVSHALVTPVTSTPTEPEPTPEPDPPIESPRDVWFREFVAAYPASRRWTDALTEHAWNDSFRGVSDEAAHYRQLRDGLANHVVSEQWAERNVIPSITKWIEQRRWTQVLAPPKSARPNTPTVLSADETRKRYLA